MSTESIDLAIALESIRLIESYFHVNPPRGSKLQSSLDIKLPHWFYNDGSEGNHPQLSGMVNVNFMLSDGPAPKQITPNNADKIAMSYGCTVDVRVGSRAMGDAIPSGKHVTIEDDDLEAHRNKRMESSLIRELLKSAYSFVSTRLVEASSLSPMGPITMPLPDYDALMEKIKSQKAD